MWWYRTTSVIVLWGLRAYENRIFNLGCIKNILLTLTLRNSVIWKYSLNILVGIDGCKIKIWGVDMRTVKQVSDLTGISVRALHYYDEIGLLKPNKITDAGYRLYDDESIKTLQQILFFKEIDIPLREVKEIMSSQYFDKVEALKNQKNYLF